MKRRRRYSGASGEGGAAARGWRPARLRWKQSQQIAPAKTKLMIVCGVTGNPAGSRPLSSGIVQTRISRPITRQAMLAEDSVNPTQNVVSGRSLLITAQKRQKA